MDATAPVRQLLYDAQIHDYELQGQGPANKVMVPAYFVNYSSVTESAASLYRPLTKKGDPRIWFANYVSIVNPATYLLLLLSTRNFMFLIYLDRKLLQD